MSIFTHPHAQHTLSDDQVLQEALDYVNEYADDSITDRGFAAFLIYRLLSMVERPNAEVRQTPAIQQPTGETSP